MNVKSLMYGAAAAALLSGAAIAQDTAAPDAAAEPMTEATEEPAAAAPAFTSLEEMTVGQVIGMRTESPDGEAIGEIDYVIEGQSGLEAVIGIGGFLGLGEYTVALPLSDFELNPDFSAFILGTTKDVLQAQPEIDESALESLPSELLIGDLMAEAGMEAEPAADEAMAEEPAADDATAEEPADDAMAEEPADDASTDMADDAADAEGEAADGEAADDTQSSN